MNKKKKKKETKKETKKKKIRKCPSIRAFMHSDDVNSIEISRTRLLNERRCHSSQVTNQRS